MPALPDPPLVQRSWLARGQFSPTPTWGQSMHAILMETSATFYRNSLTKTEMGGFAGSNPTAYMTAMVHAELEDVGSSDVLMEPGPVRKRHYLVMMKMPVDTVDLPHRSDRIRFTDPQGNVIDMPIAQVDAPEGVGDHLELRTEEFE